MDVCIVDKVHDINFGDQDFLPVLQNLEAIDVNT